VCSDGKCDCGAYVDMSLPKEHYEGRVRWENYCDMRKKVQE